ncbi:hypothetical protein KA012_01840 [Candidatus Woesebacteria bacterium]|nr:hypothetical protein [Candidatus Woesebacteria bacterium]
MTTTVENQNFKLIWSTRRQFVGLLILSVAAVALIFFFIIPEISTSWTRWGELQTAKAQEKELSDKLDQLLALETSPDLLKRGIVDSALPSRKPFFELLQSMNLVAQQTGVTIGSFELTPGLVASESAGQPASAGVSRNGATPLEVKYAASGSFAQLNDYLRKIEEVTPFTTIVKLNIGSEISNIDASETFIAGVVSETYYFTQSLTTSETAALPQMNEKSQEAIRALESYNAVVIPTQSEIIGGTENIFGDTLDIMSGN